MKSATRFSKLHGVCRDLRRFWPAPVFFGLIMLLSLSNVNLHSVDQLWLSNALIVPVAIYGALCACLLFSDLFTARYAIAVHTLPTTRGVWFLTHCLSGMVLFLIPFAAAVPLVLVMTECSLLVMVRWAAQLLVMWLYGFSIGALACTLSGTVFGAIVVSYLLAFGILLGETAISTICHRLLAGICEHSNVTTFLSPLAYTMTLYGEDISWFYYVAVAVASALVLVLAAFLHRKRALEAAGDFVAFPWLKPWIKVIATILGGITLGNFFETLVGWNRNSPQGDLIPVLRWLVPGILFGRIITEMIVEKTVRVLHKKQLQQYLLCVVTVTGIATLVWLDLPGVQTRVPEVDEVAAVEIVENYSSGDWYEKPSIVLTTPEAIEATTELHQALTGHLGCCTTGFGFRDVIFHYTMKDGSTLTRQYVMDYGSGLVPHPVDAALADFFGSRAVSQYCLLDEDCALDRQKGRITKFDILDHQSDNWYYLTPEQADGLFPLIMEDIEADNAFIDPNGSSDPVLYSIRVYTEHALDAGGIRENHGWVYIFTEDSLAAQWLEETLPRFADHARHS